MAACIFRGRPISRASIRPLPRIFICLSCQRDLDAAAREALQSSGDRGRHFRRSRFGRPFSLRLGATMKRLFEFLRGEDGPTAVEYAVMLALVIGAAISGITSFGQATMTSFQDSETKISVAVSAS